MDQQQHLCIISTAHPLDDVRVYSKVAQSFLDRGYRVSWVGPDLSRLSEKTCRDDRISYHLTRPSRNRLDRLNASRRILRLGRSVVDVDWYYAPTPDAVEVAIHLAAGNRAKVLFDVQEVYHGAFLDRWVFGRKAKSVRELVRKRITRSCTRSDLVMAVSDSVMGHYATDLKHAVVVRNCAPRWFADGPVADGGLGEGRPLRVMHGKGVPNNGTPAVLEALAELPSEKEVRVVMFPRLQKAGVPFMPDFERRVDRLGVNGRLDLRESVAHSEMPVILRTCDVGMIAYGRGLGEDSLPNRLFEYMAAGLAVLAPIYSTEIRRIVEAEHIGLSIDTERPEEISRAMSWFSEHPAETREMGLKAREAFLRRHNWDAEFDRLIDAMTRAEAGQ